MKLPFNKPIAAIAIAAISSSGFAAGELNLFNWGNLHQPRTNYQI